VGARPKSGETNDPSGWGPTFGDRGTAWDARRPSISDLKTVRVRTERGSRSAGGPSNLPLRPSMDRDASQSEVPYSGHPRHSRPRRRLPIAPYEEAADDGAVAPLILPVGPVVHDAARDEHVLLNSLGTGVGVGELMAPFVVMFVRVQDQVHLFLDQEVQDVRAGLAVVLARADAVLVESHDDPRNPLRLGVLNLSFRPVVPRRADVVRIMLTVVDPENEVR